MSRRDVAAYALAFAVIALLSWAALVLAGAEETIEVTRESAVVAAADSATGSIELAQVRMGELLLLASTDDVGSPLRPAIALRAEDALRTMQRETAAFIVVAPRSAEEMNRIRTALGIAGDEVGAAVESEDYVTAAAQAGAFEQRSAEFLAIADEIRDDAAAELALRASSASAAAQGARLFVAVIIPLLAILAARLVLRRRYDDAVRRAHEDELRREREAKDAFVMSMAHHLRTPLTGVLGFSHLLREERETFNAAERNDLIEALADEVTDISALVDDLLTVAGDVGDEIEVSPENINLRRKLEMVIDGWPAHRRNRITVSGQAQAYADPLRVRQIVRNLVLNALDHGGPSVRVSIEQRDAGAAIAVTDDGEAIPTADVPTIFDRYRKGTTSRRNPDGLGIGLWLSKHLAELMNGALTYSHDDGNRFELALPAPRPDRPTAALEPATDGDEEITSDDIVAAVAEGPRQVLFQPIRRISMDGFDQLLGYEALVRYDDGSPLRWFKAADRVGIRTELELSALSAVAVAAMDLPGEPLLTVNLSTETILSSELLDAVAPIPPTRLVLELSEEAAVANYQIVRDRILTLREHGFRLALDDFGSVDLNLWHVLRLSPWMVKIDKGIVHAMIEQPSIDALIRGLVTLFDATDTVVVAEGIEEPMHVAALRNCGVGWGQGYLLGRPSPAESETFAIA